MRFSHTEDHLAFASGLADLLAAECPPSAVRGVWESGPAGGSDAALWSQLTAMGVAGTLASEADGGMGLDDVVAALLGIELGRVAAAVPFVETMTAVPLLAGTPWAGRVATGEVTVTTGLDLGPYVPYAAQADLLVLRHGDEVHAVEASAATVTPVEPLDRGRPLAKVEWEPNSGTRLDAADLSEALDRGALLAAAVLAGLGDGMIAIATPYAAERQQFGKPIGSFQAVKHLLADALLQVEFAKPPVERASWSLATGAPTRTVDCSMAKCLAGDAAAVAARKTLQVHGGIGYTWEHDLHLWMKKAWSLAASWGDATHHRRLVSRHLRTSR